MRKVIFLTLLSVCGISPSALAQDLAGNWVGQMNGDFKVRIHFERIEAGFSGKLINSSGNETVLEFGHSKMQMCAVARNLSRFIRSS